MKKIKNFLKRLEVNQPALASLIYALAIISVIVITSLLIKSFPLVMLPVFLILSLWALAYALITTS